MGISQLSHAEVSEGMEDLCLLVVRARNPTVNTLPVRRYTQRKTFEFFAVCYPA